MTFEGLLKFYKEKMERKKKIIVEYIQENNSEEGFKSSKRETEYKVLKAEIKLLEKLINDLETVNFWD